VRWHWIPVTWAVLTLLFVVQSWWAYFSIVRAPVWLNLFAFLLPLLVFIVVFLICASTLPDAKSIPEQGTFDLEAFHFSQRRYFFTLWLVLLVLAIVVVWTVSGRVHFEREIAFRLGGVLVAVVLIATGRKPVHAVVTGIAALALVTYIALYRLRLP
jgi:hypothetical protein